MENMQVLEKIRQVNNKIRQTKISSIDMNEDFPFQELVQYLGIVLASNTYLLSVDGRVLGYYGENENMNSQRTKAMISSKKIDPLYMERLQNIQDTVENISSDDDRSMVATENREMFVDALTTIIPIFGGSEKVGYLILARPRNEFDVENLILGEYVAMVLALELGFLNMRIEEKKRQKRLIVSSAVQSLSFSEVQALRAIFRHSDGARFRITASKIAADEDITRSVIVNALRKMESAGVLSSHSLGMKGTFIDAHNDDNLEEIQRQLQNSL
ncbi:MAG: GTP-sensing pleiotropic transcriptional regulator CodY [Aerococcus sp.]|nr:GTP-sensing pleiotropic transcriptional regulator CodY [Aerococcus sp.]